MADTKETIKQNKEAFKQLKDAIASVTSVTKDTNKAFIELKKTLETFGKDKTVEETNNKIAESVKRITKETKDLATARKELYKADPINSKEWRKAYRDYETLLKKEIDDSGRKNIITAWNARNTNGVLKRHQHESDEDYNKRVRTFNFVAQSYEKKTGSNYYEDKNAEWEALKRRYPDIVAQLVKEESEKILTKSRGFRGVKYRDWYLEEMMDKDNPKSIYSSMTNRELRAAQDFLAEGSLGGLLSMIGPNRRLGNIREVNKQIIDTYRDRLYAFGGQERDITHQMEKIENLYGGRKNGKFDASVIDTLEHQKDYDRLTKELEVLRKNKKDYEDNYGGKYTSARIKAGVAASFQGAYNFSRKILKAFGDMFGITLSIKQFASDIFGRVKELINVMPTYDTSNSLITNSQAREQQMRYGLSDTQNFAFSQSKAMLGINSEEDLLYMNPNQQRLFTQYMQKYSAWYTELMDSGVLQDIQEFKLEFKMYKEELAMDILKWLADNKETIMAVLNMTFAVMKGLITVLGGIARFFGFSADFASTSTAVNNSSLVSARNVNINVTNNATGVLGSEESMQAFYDEQQSKLAKILDSTSD